MKNCKNKSPEIIVFISGTNLHKIRGTTPVTDQSQSLIRTLIKACSHGNGAAVTPYTSVRLGSSAPERDRTFATH